MAETLKPDRILAGQNQKLLTAETILRHWDGRTGKFVAIEADGRLRVQSLKGKGFWTFPPEECASVDPARTDRAVAHRFRFAADILEGMTDGIDGDRLGALVRWALHGKTAPDELDDLIRIFAAPHQAAVEEGAWKGNPRTQALRDIERITGQAAAIPG